MKISPEFGCTRENAPTLNVRKGKAKYRRGQQYGGGSAMKTAALELTSKKIPNKNMILQGIIKTTSRGIVENVKVTVWLPRPQRIT